MKKIPSAQQCEKVSGVLKTLAHPQRLMILCQLACGPKTVGELEELTKTGQSAVSQFLIRMKNEGLVVNKRQGQNMIYQIADPKVEKILHSLYRIYCNDIP